MHGLSMLTKLWKPLYLISLILKFAVRSWYANFSYTVGCNTRVGFSQGKYYVVCFTMFGRIYSRMWTTASRAAVSQFLMFLPWKNIFFHLYFYHEKNKKSRELVYSIQNCMIYSYIIMKTYISYNYVLLEQHKWFRFISRRINGDLTRVVIKQRELICWLESPSSFSTVRFRNLILACEARQ
jgi:hypothetical protein